MKKDIQLRILRASLISMTLRLSSSLTTGTPCCQLIELQEEIASTFTELRALEQDLTESTKDLHQISGN
jgi:hypothetical protein